MLDAGCGAGDYSVALRQAGARSVNSFDVSVGRMRLAASKNTMGRFAQASLTDLPYRSESFDVIWVWGILHYVPDPVAALHEITRTLRPGGVAVIHTSRRGFWSWLEVTGGKLFSKIPRWMQAIVLTIGERMLSLVSRVMTGRRPEEQTSKTIRQKLQERLFAPGNVGMFSLDELTWGFGMSIEVREIEAPVTDLLKRNMSITVIAHKK